MGEAPGQPSEDAFGEVIEEALQGSDDSFAGVPEYEPEPPDVGESLQQMNQRLEELGSRLDETDYEDEDEDWDPDALQYNPAIAQPEDDQNDILRQLLADEVAEQVKPYTDAVEQSFREQQILQLAERYPALREPDVLDAVSGELEQFAQAYNTPGALTDPRLIEQFLVAHLAQQAVAEAPEPSQDGAHLETGTGPGEPQQEVDPTTQAWLNAAMPDPKRDVFS
jgi:hypothetical protein